MDFNFTQEQIIGDIITGLTSSGMFLFLLYLLKPKIRLSDFITHTKENEIHEDLYYFKIINRSLFFKIYDIKFRVYSCENIPSHNGDDVALREIALRKSNQWVLARMNFRHLWQDTLIAERRINTRSDYAAQFSTLENLKDYLNKKRFIRVEVLARHSLTGFSIVKTKTYKHMSNIKEGSFNSGNSYRILK